MTARHDQGDDWLRCDCGREHWGLFGAAGLLLARLTTDGLQILLQHRAAWSDGGATWGIPGGALDADETPEEGALRETAEEAGLPAEAVQIIGTSVLDHGNWSYTTVLALAMEDFEIAIDDESLAMEWVDVERVSALPLLSAFRGSWEDGLRERLTSTLMAV